MNLSEELAKLNEEKETFLDRQKSEEQLFINRSQARETQLLARQRSNNQKARTRYHIIVGAALSKSLKENKEGCSPKSITQNISRADCLWIAEKTQNPDLEFGAEVPPELLQEINRKCRNELSIKD